MWVCRHFFWYKTCSLDQFFTLRVAERQTPREHAYIHTHIRIYTHILCNIDIICKYICIYAVRGWRVEREINLENMNYAYVARINTRIYPSIHIGMRTYICVHMYELICTHALWIGLSPLRVADQRLEIIVDDMHTCAYVICLKHTYIT